MESMIDQRYRLDLIQHHLEGFEEKQGKAVFFCPLCQFSRPQGKYVQKKGGMFWCQQWNGWRFNCMKCLRQATTMYRYLEKVNPEMAQRYQQDRWYSGTTGKGHDCPSPVVRDCSMSGSQSTSPLTSLAGSLSGSQGGRFGIYALKVVEED